MTFRCSICGYAILLIVACGGSSATTAPAAVPTTTTTTSATSVSSLDGRSYDVTLEFPGEQPTRDGLNFSSGKFESTACTSLGFPKSTDYTLRDVAGSNEFHVATKHPSGTTMDWTGTVKGDAIEGTATRTMNGKTDVGHFKGAVRR